MECFSPGVTECVILVKLVNEDEHWLVFVGRGTQGVGASLRGSVERDSSNVT